MAPPIKIEVCLDKYSLIVLSPEYPFFKLQPSSSKLLLYAFKRCLSPSRPPPGSSYILGQGMVGISSQDSRSLSSQSKAVLQPENSICLCSKSSPSSSAMLPPSTSDMIKVCLSLSALPFSKPSAFHAISNSAASGSAKKSKKVHQRPDSAV